MHKLILLSFSILITSFSFCQSSNLDSAIYKIMQKYHTVGLSIVIVKNDMISSHKNYGYKSLENKEALQDNDIFRIASISKSFTASSFMQLIAEGKCKLDDDFGDLIGFPIRNPKFPNKKITLKMVLSHTSSINDKNGYFDLDVINSSKNPNYATCYNDYAPGDQYEYCNLNFNMAGAVLEKLSGQRFDQYIVKHILEPLHLYGGYCVDSLDKSRFVPLYEYNDSIKSYEIQPNAYNPKRKELSNYILGYSTPNFSPTGGMKMSTMDLAKYMMMHMHQGKLNSTRIIKKKLSKLMQTPVNIEAQYGLAIERSKHIIEGIELIGHEGSAYGLHSAMYFEPKKKFGFVIITNGVMTEDTNTLNPFLKECINILYQLAIQ